MSALAPREVHGGVKNDNAVNTNATMNSNASVNTNTTMNNNASVNTNATMNSNASVNTNTTMNNNASMNTIPHNTNTNHTDANDIQSLTIQKTLLERKLQNMVELTERDNAQEEYQRETVKHYEQELEAKQRTILRLTQANREFEQLCVGTITGTGDAAKLREENERLKKRVAELEAQVTELEEDKDKMREAMVKMCTEKWRV